MKVFSDHRVRRGTARLLLLVTLVFGLVGAFANSQDRNQISEHQKGLLSGDARTRNQAVDSMLQDRKRIIDQLLVLVDPANAKKYSDQTRAAAGFVLGQLRSVEAVGVLSKALANEPHQELFGDTRRFEAPFVIALAKIGRPAVPAMIENLETSDHRMLRIRSLDVLNHVLGGKRRMLELLGKLKARAARDPEKLRRIEKAINRVRTHYKEDKEPLY
ncbi:MAG: hypothetical protein AMS16_03275 [Planctomycetes bacterium DG_58]|nr:MAG: hypothetical protein AMS16_03275 [Planctomycetes bacterium DG_58]